jgi:hypothetical protein
MNDHINIPAYKEQIQTDIKYWEDRKLKFEILAAKDVDRDWRKSHNNQARTAAMNIAELKKKLEQIP